MNRNWLARKILALAQKNTEAVIQDVEIPVEHAAEFLAFFMEKIAIKPIWICPTKPYASAEIFNLYPMDPQILYVNFGFWDIVPSTQPEGYYNRLIEQKVQELGGKKGLYSNVYYPKEEFWQIHDQVFYQQLKAKYDSDTRLGDLYQKCSEKM